jgi:hypothetical protein
MLFPAFSKYQQMTCRHPMMLLLAGKLIPSLLKHETYHPH